MPQLKELKKGVEIKIAEYLAINDLSEIDGYYLHMAQTILSLIEQQDCEGYREIVEIYAGMEGFIPETAPEGYQQKIIRDMYEVASKQLKA